MSPQYTAGNRYRVHSMFSTIQGEGANAGKACVFVRFSACNVWTGLEKDRRRDAEKNSECARFCDTVFNGIDSMNGGGDFSAHGLVDNVAGLAAGGNRMVVLTGGEPGLQIKPELIEEFHRNDFFVCVETNGTKELPDGVDWVTISPKFPMPLVNREYEELKVLSCYLDNPIYMAQAEMISAAHRWVQPVDYGNFATDVNRKEIDRCVKFVMKHPNGWRMGMQQHKVWSVP